MQCIVKDAPEEIIRSYAPNPRTYTHSCQRYIQQKTHISNISSRFRSRPSSSSSSSGLSENKCVGVVEEAVTTPRDKDVKGTNAEAAAARAMMVAAIFMVGFDYIHYGCASY